MRERRGASEPLMRQARIQSTVRQHAATGRYTAVIIVPHTHPWNEMPAEEIIFDRDIGAVTACSLADGCYMIAAEDQYESERRAQKTAKEMQAQAVRVREEHLAEHVSTVDGIASSTRY